MAQIKTAEMKETIEMVSFVLELGNAIGASLEDGKIDWSDLMRFFGALKMAGPAIKGYENIPEEMKNLTPAMKEELKTYVSDKLDLPNDKIEFVVEAALKVAIDLISVVNVFRKG